MPKNITIYLPDKTAKEMKKYQEVNWSEICRSAILDYLKTRESINPRAEVKFSNLKKKERAEGFKFGARLAEELTDLLGYAEINELLEVWDFTCEQSPEELGDIGGFFGFVDESWKYSYHTEEEKAEIEKRKKEKGNFVWLIDLASKKEGFHKNWEFVGGIFEALEEIFLKGRM